MIAVDKLTRIQLEEASEFLSHQLPFVNMVDLVIQLGSGQTTERLLDQEWNRIALQQMPHLPFEQSLAQHKLEIVWGTLHGRKVLVYAGRFHMYEGYGRIPCVLPIWAAAYCGARNFLFSNASGAIRPSLTPGRFMCLTDHINNLGVSPLAGLHHLVDTPYVDMSRTYSAEMRAAFISAAAELGESVEEGVYMANMGPQFETPAEVQMARLMGVDTVGMSTVLEATTAHALGARVLAVSMITNMATGVASSPNSHSENMAVGKSAGRRLVEIIRNWLASPTPGLDRDPE